jgi:hypothetical protein
MLKIKFNPQNKSSKVFLNSYFSCQPINYVDHLLHRDLSIKKLVLDASKLISEDIIHTMRQFELTVDTSDFFGFSAKKYHDKLFPDFNFDKWSEVGNYDYHDITQKMLIESEKLPKFDQLYWIGSYDCHWSRRKLGDMTKEDTRINIVNVNNWHWDDKLKRAVTNNGKYTSMLDHCKFKYLIDFQGYGYSGRTKYLLHSGRPLFYVLRDWNEYWYFNMEPMKHFIPIKSDLSDFYEKFEWVENNYDKALYIANNAKEFAKHNLKKSDAINKYKTILITEGLK